MKLQRLTRLLATFLLLATAAVALTACGKGEEKAGAEQEAAAEHTPAHSSAGLPSGNAEAGEKLATAKNAKTGQSCVDCHGAEGNAPIDETYPKLAGQYYDYIAHSLQAYRSGDRDHPLMSSQAKSLTDQQISDLGVYFASSPSELRDLSGVE